VPLPDLSNFVTGVAKEFGEMRGVRSSDVAHLIDMIRSLDLSDKARDDVACNIGSEICRLDRGELREPETHLCRASLASLVARPGSPLATIRHKVSTQNAQTEVRLTSGDRAGKAAAGANDRHMLRRDSSCKRCVGTQSCAVVHES
jgi:hypothetical protein